MKSEEKINVAIIKLMANINRNCPELLKFLDEMTIDKTSFSKCRVSQKKLEEYYKSLKNLLKGYLFNKSKLGVKLTVEIDRKYMKIVRSWREQKILLKRWFPFLTDDDFIIDEGDKDSMLDHLSKKLNKTRSELELLFAELQRY